MAEIHPFRGLRYDTARVDAASVLAPPYDVISPAQQRALYDRSDANIVRIEYGETSPSDTDTDDRYTRAAADLKAWIARGVLQQDEHPALYAYLCEFEWEGRTYARRHWFAAVRLEPWSAGVIKPHEHTLSNPKADRMNLLRATRTQVSPVYCVYRGADGGGWPEANAAPVLDCIVDGQRHLLWKVTDTATIDRLRHTLAASDVYIADGHHRYETALAYRDEAKASAKSWSGDEPANFVLMALTPADDDGLLVLPTHRLVNPPRFSDDAMERIRQLFHVEEIDAVDARSRLEHAAGTAFVAVGLEAGRVLLLSLIDRAAAEAPMPAGQPDAWKRLDVSVLQYAVLQEVFGVDDAVLAAGTALSYTQDADEAFEAVATGRARLAFLLNATPVEQVIDVSDAGARMPQKSTYFYPKLPTGHVMHRVE
jgi:uncharacterized protein (DUF1015 family)